jgi:hypothetical protein
LPHPLAEPVLDRLHGPESSLETAYGSRDYEYYSVWWSIARIEALLPLYRR